MPRFRREKLKALLLHTLASTPPGELSLAGLSVVLFLADVIHLDRTGSTISGETYVRDRAGAASRHLATVRAELISSGLIEEFTVESESGPRTFIRISPARKRRAGVGKAMDKARAAGSLTAGEMTALGIAVEWAHGIDWAHRAGDIDPARAIEAVAEIGQPIDLAVALRKRA